jgi:pyruvate/2-oxoacid:ferredoxin oxidoreductase beta subunit
MNTGIQRSGTSPLHGWTTTTPVGKEGKGKGRQGKYMPLIMASHGIPYVATASVAYLEDYARKLKKAMAVKDGLSYIHLLTPCPTGWRSPTDSGIELSRMAVETNYFPLWEAENGEYRFTYKPKKIRPVQEFTKMMGRFSHLTDVELQEFQRQVDKRMAFLSYLNEYGKGSAPTDER